MFLTETWFNQDNSAVLIESAPRNQGGGIAILFNNSFQCRQMSYGRFASFKYMLLLSWIPVELYS